MKLRDIKITKSYYTRPGYCYSIIDEIRNSSTISRYDLGVIRILFSSNIKSIRAWLEKQLKSEHITKNSILVIFTDRYCLYTIEEYNKKFSDLGIFIIASNSKDSSGIRRELEGICEMLCEGDNFKNMAKDTYETVVDGCKDSINRFKSILKDFFENDV